MGYVGTKHLGRRMRQRGVTDERLSTLLDWADTEVHVGGGDVCLSASRAAVDEMAAEGVPAPMRGRMKDLAVVMASDGVLKTCLVIRKSGRGGRRYRRGK